MRLFDGWLSKFLFHHKKKEAGLLVINNYTRVAKRIKTYDLSKLANIKKVSELYRILPSAQSSDANKNVFCTGNISCKTEIKLFP